MNFVKSTSLVAVSVIATLAVASIFGFQVSSITAEEDEDKGYTFAEDVSVTGVFKFREGTEVAQFEVFAQNSGWERAEPFTFELQKIVGNTPMLHKHADFSQTYRSSTVQKVSDNEFNVDIILSDGGDLKRVFSYDKCYVDSYFVDTLHDKEEGWNSSKGFAYIDVFEFQCRGYVPNNPQYEEMHEITEDEEAHTTSSLDLVEPFQTWSDDFRYKGGY